MTDVIHRTNYAYIQSVNTPEYPSGTWLQDPDLSGVAGVPSKYWKVSGESVLEMSQAEKDAVDASYITSTPFGDSSTVENTCKNTSGATITKGTPVYITGIESSTEVPTIGKAQASTGSTMPAIGLAKANILDDDYGTIVRLGIINGVNTSGDSANDYVYVGATGGFTTTPPGNEGDVHQRVGQVMQAHAEDGIIVVFMHDAADTDWLGGIEIDYAAKADQFALAYSASANKIIFKDLSAEGTQTTTLGEAGSPDTSWILSAGDLYYQTFAHNLGTEDLVAFCINTVTGKQVHPEDIEIVDTNTIKVWVRGNTHVVKVNVVSGSGAQGPQGPAGSGLSDVVDDTTPQLGGNLDLNTNTITGFTASRALETDGSGNLQVSAVTSAEIAHLDGVTSAIQTQLDGKMANTVEDTTPQLGGDLEVNLKCIKIDPALSSDLTATGTAVNATVDTNATGIGAVLFMAADGNFDEADADAASTMPCRALALESGTGTKNILMQGFLRKDAWNWVPGGALFVSTTTGALTQMAPTGTGDQVQKVGFAWSADIVYFNPDYTIVEVG